MHDPPRPAVKEAVSRAKEGHISIVVLTGDSKETAISVARDIGVWENDSIALSGVEIETYSEALLAEKLDRVHIFYRVAPSHKVKIVQAYRLRGHAVAMTGFFLKKKKKLISRFY